MAITPSLVQLLIQVAAGDAEKLPRLHEICSWFPDLVMLYKDTVDIADCLIDDEKARMRPNRSLLVEYLYWVMMEAESDDMVQSYHWRACKPSHVEGADHGTGQGEGTVLGRAAGQDT